jgi:hypothetical protein
MNIKNVESSTLCHLAPAGLVACLVFCLTSPLKAGFIANAGHGTYFYSDDSRLGDSRSGDSPSAFTVAGTSNGMTYSSEYQSDYSVTKSVTATSESLLIQLSGAGPAGGIPLQFRPSAYSEGFTAVDYSGLQLPGYDESFYVSVNIVLKGNLAAGDTLSYNIGANLAADVFGPYGNLFEYNVSGTITTPGVFSIDLSVPQTYVTDLIDLHLHGVQNLHTSFAIFSTRITRGNDGSEMTTVNFDPGISNYAIPNTAPDSAVPEPSTLLIMGVGTVLVLSLSRQPHRLATAPLLDRKTGAGDS